MRRSILTATGFAILLWMPLPAGAEVVGEGVSTLRCSEGVDLELPKRIELIQTLAGDQFTTHEEVFLFLDSEFAELTEAGGGKITATVFHHKANGASAKLGRFKAKLDEEARAEGDKKVAATLEKGDRLEWKIKLTGMPRVRGDLEDCWDLSLFVVVGDDLG